MRTINNKKEYLKLFEGPVTGSDKQKEALKQALDIRKFEIDLYWKRSAYFWTLITAIFAGYFAIQHVSPSPPFDFILIVSSVGLVLSFGWYCVNRGSKYWQETWEQHVDLLEDDVMGPLYKTSISRFNTDFLKLEKSFPFSVSKINQLLSLFISIIWLYLFFKNVIIGISSNFWETFIILVFTGHFIVFLIWKGYTKSPAEQDIEISMQSRTYR